MDKEEDPSTPEYGKRVDIISETGGKLEEKEVVEDDKRNKVEEKWNRKLMERRLWFESKQKKEPCTPDVGWREKTIEE